LKTKPSKLSFAPPVTAPICKSVNDGGATVGGGGGLIVLMILFELKTRLFTVWSSFVLVVRAVLLLSTSLIANVDSDVCTGGGGAEKGLRVVLMPFELKRMPSTTLSPRFLEPLRPALLLPVMEVATKAAMAKQATIILMGVERVMLER
jgi:hypothetical protein